MARAARVPSCFRDARRLKPCRSLGSFFGHDSHLSIDYISKLCYIASHPRSLRGVSGDILKAERGVASCGGRLVTACLGRPGTPPARHYDLAARSSLHGSEGKCPPL